MREGMCSIEPRMRRRGNAQQTLEHLEEAELDSKVRNPAWVLRLLQASTAGVRASELGRRGAAHPGPSVLSHHSILLPARLLLNPALPPAH